MRPSTVIEVQHELYAFMLTRKATGFFQGQGRRADGRDLHLPDSVVQARTDVEAITLRRAPAYLITGDMLKLAVHAAKSLPAAPIRREDLPSDHGFVVFEEGLLVPDVRGKFIVMTGFTWSLGTLDGGSRPTVIWTIYSDPYDKRDQYYDTAMALNLARLPGSPPWFPVGNDIEELGAGEHTIEEIVGAFADTDSPIEAANVHPAILYTRRLPLALWALMQQTITVKTEARPERAARRRLEKIESPLAAKMVKVVQLRRVREGEKETQTHHSVEWTHRWIVNGHWREQACGVQWKDRKRIWVAPFVKGDADLPLVLKETVHVLER